MSELYILYINILLYLSAFLFFKVKYGFFNLSTICTLFYLLGSIASLLFFLTPVYFFTFSNDGKLNVEGMLWLFVFNFLLCLLLRNFNFSKTNLITSYNQKFIDNLQKTLIIAYVVFLIFDLPVSIQNINSGNLADLRDITYSEGANGSKFFLVSLIRRIFAEMDLLLLCISIFNILVLKRRRRIDLLSILVYSLFLLDTISALISRFVIISHLTGLVIILIALREFIEKRILKLFFFVGTPILVSLFFIFNSITNSRFGENNTNQEAQYFANLRYAGEPQVNFIALMYNKTEGCSYGYRSFPLFRKLVGLEYFGQAGTDKTANLVFLDKIHSHPNYILYTVAGDWYLDLGTFWPIAILISLNVLIAINYNKSQKFNFFSYIFAAILGYYVCSGIYFGQYQSESGNLLFLLMVFLYYKSRGRNLAVNNCNRKAWIVSFQKRYIKASRAIPPKLGQHFIKNVYKK